MASIDRRTSPSDPRAAPSPLPPAPPRSSPLPPADLGSPKAIELRRPPRLHRRTVGGRLLGSYVLVFLAFALTVGWSVQALRAAARDAELLRAGYVPLLLRIGEALAEQNVFNAQLNHITASKIPSDVRDWIDAVRRTRPRTFSLVRKSAEPPPGTRFDPEVRRFGEDIAREASGIEDLLEADQERFDKLFQAFSAGDRDAAERARNDLVKREAEAAQKLRALRVRVDDNMERLIAAARQREARSMHLLVGLGLLTLLVGVMTSLYARRVLLPLSHVTARAGAVARGDLTPHQVVDTHDEIGELATSFEHMVSAIQRARAEVVQAERLATIGKMAAHITHEIRNPLSSIGLNVELLEEEVARAGDKEPLQLVLAIKSEVDRLSRIAEQYLSVARRPRPDLAREHVEDLVAELLAFVRPELERGGITARLEVDPDLPEVSVDEAQIRQALLNLIRNAREAMPRGGELRIRATRQEANIEVWVDDNGTGVPEEMRATIFDPFVTTKQRGTGLGLAVTREIIEAHHGTIHCEPLPTNGTRFRIVLPVGDA